MLAGRSRGASAIGPRQSSGPAPLSFAQQRLWFLQQVEPHNPFYNVAATVRLRGPLQRDVLEKAIHEIIRRHEILRTRFQQTAAEPVQIVNQQSAWRLAYTDLRAQPDQRRDVAAREIAIADADQPFDLTGDSLVRTRLICLEPNHHLLVLVLHHIICDGWSMNVFRSELTQLYAAYSAGQPSPLADLELQYADYAAWQREWLPAQVGFDDHLRYWVSQLADNPGTLELPRDYARTDQSDFDGANAARQLPPILIDQLERFALAERGTLFMGLLAAWKLLLSKYTGQTDICVGAPIANRRFAELEPSIGMFVNTLALRTDLSGDLTFRQLFARVREVFLQAEAHRDVPLEKLVEQLQPARDPRQTPLFNTLFVMQDMPSFSLESGDLQVTEIDLGIGQRTHYDLTLNTTVNSGRADLLLVYRSELFQRDTIQRWMETYEALLTAAVAEPNRPLSDLPVPNEDERRQLIVQWNQTNAAFPNACIHELISNQARRTPRAIAVECAGEQLTYLELEQRATWLARLLHQRGAASNRAVAIFLPRTPDIIVAMLGVLKAGAAYLVCDPTYPTRRVVSMLRDADADVVITDTSMADIDLEVGNIVAMDAELQSVVSVLDSPIPTCAKPNDLAYLVYTSGSSGAPKAVEVPHRGLVNHAIHFAKRMRVGPGSRQIQNLSLSFDASAEEIFPTLIGGGTIVMNPTPAEMTAAQLLEFCQQKRVDTLHVVAPMWHHLVEVLQQRGPELFAGLKTVVTGADTIGSRALAQWCRHLGKSLRMLFVYGVTEATIATTIYEVPGEFDDNQRVPIGKPIANHRVYVLDRHQQPVPLGAVGELYIGGVGVAQGYLRRPQLTKSRFLDDPFHHVPGSRMYRTGDRARWRADGELEFQGRIDEQLKVSGYRIEPGEIESALMALETVTTARVIGHEDQSGRRLVGYVVPAVGRSPTPMELRAAVAAQLPRHMVPAAIVLLDEIPLTPNGKVDEAALPSPEWGNEGPGAVLPRNHAEAMFANIWADLLGLQQVSVDANFFALGGDSILSLQVVSRANAAGWQVTPKQMLEHQTIAGLAAVAVPATTFTEPIVVTGYSPLSPIQRQFFDEDLAEPHFFHQGVLLNVLGPIGTDVIQQAWTAVVEHHDVMCSLFAIEHGLWRQHFTGQSAGADRLQHSDLAAVSDGDLPEEIVRISQRIQADLDFQRGPIAAAAYFDLGDNRAARLFLVAHHLVVDAVSWRILIGDLQRACQQIINHVPIELPPKTTSFKTWVERLEQAARDPQLHEQAAYWLDMPADDSVPMDAKSVDNCVFDVDQVVITLDANITRTLLTDAQQAYRTRVDEFLLAALARTLADWRGTRRVRVDCERHGRDYPFTDVDLSRTVGWCTACVPVELELPDKIDQDRPDALLCTVKEQLRAVLSHGIDYGLARWLAPDRDLRERVTRLAQAEISFNYLGRLDASNASADGEALFSLAKEPLGPFSHGNNRRWHLLEMIAYIQNDEMHIKLFYNRRLYHHDTMIGFLDALANWLDVLTKHCLDPVAGRFTPSDFPLADADQDDLATLTRLLGESDDRR